MSIFAGMARQAAALPPIQQRAPAPVPSRGRGLFGGGRQGPDMNSVLTFLTQGTNGLDRSRANQMAEQQRLATTQNEDRLRAELSPMDGPQGSGTGAMPSLDQQMRALDDARLRDPAVAERFAPVVQQRRMAELMQGRPIEERLATELNPEQAGQSYASQFEDVPLAAGTVRSRGGNIIAAAPRTERFDDRFGTYNPMTGETTYSQPRDMTEDERSRRIAAERPTIANVAPGGTALAFGTDGSVVNTVQSTAVRPLGETALRSIDEADQNLTRVGTSINRARQIAAQIDGGQLNLGPMSNMVAAGRNLTGNSNQNSLNFDALNQWAKEARNAVLQANTGVQTDQDAIRELDTIISGTRDERVVRAALDRYIEASEATTAALQRGIERRARTGVQGAQAQPQGGQASPQVIYDPQGNPYVVRNGQWVPQ